MLNLKYKLYVRKHVLDIAPQNISHFDDTTPENNSVIDDDHVHGEVEVDFVASHVETVNNNNKKSHEIVTRNKA